MTEKQIIAFRADPEQRRKLVTIARNLGEGDNMSAAIKYLIDSAPVGQAGQQNGEVKHG